MTRHEGKLVESFRQTTNINRKPISNLKGGIIYLSMRLEKYYTRCNAARCIEKKRPIRDQCCCSAAKYRNDRSCLIFDSDRTYTVVSFPTPGRSCTPFSHLLPPLPSSSLVPFPSLLLPSSFFLLLTENRFGTRQQHNSRSPVLHAACSVSHAATGTEI